MPKVYVIHDQGRTNLTPAEDFGELIPCLTGRYSHLMGKRVFANLRESLRDITRDDYIIPIGNPTYIAMAGGIIMEKLGSMKMLQWDGQSQKYTVVEVTP